ncbi:MAG: hypothetical protein LBB98_11600 [Treponema sp.]|jgi:hypothetical protein|nr:hypothetical protein [Treponema sp.]
MEYRERDYGNEPPTLLAAGLKEMEVSGSGKITIVMWPIVVDTVFTAVDPDVRDALRTSAPAMNAGKPGTATLLPVGWNVTWMVKKGASGDGFSELINAQNAADPGGSGKDLKVRSGQTIIRGTGLDDTEVTYEGGSVTNVITLPMGAAYTAALTRIGKGGSVSFKLEYVPFNLTAGEKWAPFKGEPPVWIIRNGVNDLVQDGDTDFTGLGKGTANGNGAVGYTVAAGIPAEGTLVIKDGEYITGSSPAEITFTTEGYE